MDDLRAAISPGPMAQQAFRSGNFGVLLGIHHDAGRSTQRNTVCIHATNEHAGQRISMCVLNALYSALCGLSKITFALRAT